MRANPCLQCGACCAVFRVSFYWAETTAGTPDGVPVDMVEKLDSFRVYMKGTNEAHPRCCALEGTIGAAVQCSIHPRRAGVCREFPASFEDGVTANERCDKARAHFGLRPLTPDDWTAPPDTFFPDIDKQAG